MEIKTRNVNSAFLELVQAIHSGEKKEYGAPPVIRRQTRNGPVLQVEEPVMVSYSRPRERVLFNPSRDANPFFHLYEALWMLTGRNDAEPLAYYASRMKTYSDDGKTLNGAYGYRWRHAKYERDDHGMYDTGSSTDRVDQLDILVQHLKADPTSRRAVLTMWNVEDDLLKIGANPDRSGNFYNPDLKFPPSKDVCCNLNVMFSIRELLTITGPTYSGKLGSKEIHGFRDAVPMKYLDMTVTNRSNDMIWGMLGANYVHFTFLQEYMASRLNCEVGRYTQFTNNLHVYESNWKPQEWLKDAHVYDYGFHVGAGSKPEYNFPAEKNSFIPLVSNVERFERELPAFVAHHSGRIKAGEQENLWEEPFLSEVAGPLLCAFSCYKEKDFNGANIMIDQVRADDWRFVARNWISKRQSKGRMR